MPEPSAPSRAVRSGWPEGSGPPSPGRWANRASRKDDSNDSKPSRARRGVPGRSTATTWTPSAFVAVGYINHKPARRRPRSQPRVLARVLCRLPTTAGVTAQAVWLIIYLRISAPLTARSRRRQERVCPDARSHSADGMLLSSPTPSCWRRRRGRRRRARCSVTDATRIPSAGCTVTAEPMCVPAVVAELRCLTGRVVGRPAATMRPPPSCPRNRPLPLAAETAFSHRNALNEAGAPQAGPAPPRIRR
jgi:hypothetical protein